MARIILTLLIAGAALSLPAPAALASDDAYLQDKYREALRRGCQPVIVKRTVFAAALGFLPGGGLYFTENYGGAIRDTLLWPLSVLWDPFLAVRLAKEKNMQATIAACRAPETTTKRK